MKKTGIEIEVDLFNLLKNSALSSMINGEVYYFGDRPKDSVNEDAIIKFVTADYEQKQVGRIVLNMYVPDVNSYNDGVLRRNSARCLALEQAVREWVDTLTSNDQDGYEFYLADTITTEAEAEINQHFIYLKLEFKRMSV